MTTTTGDAPMICQRLCVAALVASLHHSFCLKESSAAPPTFTIAPVPLSPSGESNLARDVTALGLVSGIENGATGSLDLIVSGGVSTIIAGMPSYSTLIESTQGTRINDDGIVAGAGRYNAPLPGETSGTVPYDRGVVFNSARSSHLEVLEPYNDAGGRAVCGLSVSNTNRVVGNAPSGPISMPFPRRGFWYDVDPNQPFATYKLDSVVHALPFPTNLF